MLKINTITMEDKIEEVAKTIESFGATKEEAAKALRVLLDVVQQSEPCKHPRSEREYVGEGYLKCRCDSDTKDLIEHTKRVLDLIKPESGIAVKVLSNRVNKKLEQLK